MSDSSKHRLFILVAIVPVLLAQIILSLFLHATASHIDFHDPDEILGADYSTMDRSALEILARNGFSGLVQAIRGYSKLFAVVSCLLVSSILVQVWLLFSIGRAPNATSIVKRET